MATTAVATEPVSKSDFVINLLKVDSTCSLSEINNAWAKRGGEGTISGTTFARAKKSAVKLGSATKGKPGRKPGATSAPKPALTTGETEQTRKAGIAFEIETDLDKILFRIQSSNIDKDDQVASAIRYARRMLVTVCLD